MLISKILKQILVSSKFIKDDDQLNNLKQTYSGQNAIKKTKLKSENQVMWNNFGKSLETLKADIEIEEKVVSKGK